VTTRSPQAVLRDATAADRAAVAAAEHDLFGADAWSPALVAHALGDDARTTVLAEVDGVLTGYAVLALAGDVADLERIAVGATHRRTGLGSALLDAVRARARVAGAERLLLEVRDGNRAAEAFYAAHGAVIIDRRRRYYRDGSDALVLQVPLVGSFAGEENSG
jgi:[ribosomal protein S18]-alanine N-acetyltransferase